MNKISIFLIVHWLIDGDEFQRVPVLIRGCLVSMICNIYAWSIINLLSPGKHLYLVSKTKLLRARSMNWIIVTMHQVHQILILTVFMEEYEK